MNIIKEWESQEAWCLENKLYVHQDETRLLASCVAMDRVHNHSSSAAMVMMSDVMGVCGLADLCISEAHDNYDLQ